MSTVDTTDTTDTTGDTHDYTLVDVHLALARALGTREAIVQGQRRVTWAAFENRTAALARHLVALGLGTHIERADLEPHQSGQDHLGLYMMNCPEYLEATVGAHRARVAPFNVNYRYVEEELRYLLTDAAVSVLVYHGRFAPILEKVLPALGHPVHLLQVADDSGTPLLAGAVDYESALSGAPTIPLPVPSPDDLALLYTGGTTGAPKGVMWRSADYFVSALGGRDFSRGGAEWPSLQAMVERAAARQGYRALPAAPLMHGAALWLAFQALHAGGSVVLAEHAGRFDARATVDLLISERVDVLQIVGDPFAVPLIDALRRAPVRPPLTVVASGGAVLRPEVKAQLVELLPGLKVRDTMGASETGPQAQTTAVGAPGGAASFRPASGACVISEDRDRMAADDEIGWLATTGRVPLGYLGDPEKTAATFPVVEGRRMAVPGDRARRRADGTLEVLGRDSTTINTGGEKVYAQEVEMALARHPAVADVLVVGRSDPRFGQEIVAVVQPVEGRVPPGAPELAQFCADDLAPYKRPRAVVIVDAVVRSPAGKPDYRWARAAAEAAR